jgi:hypothetical protein
MFILSTARGRKGDEAMANSESLTSMMVWMLLGAVSVHGRPRSIEASQNSTARALRMRGLVDSENGPYGCRLTEAGIAARAKAAKELLAKYGTYENIAKSAFWRPQDPIRVRYLFEN